MMGLKMLRPNKAAFGIPFGLDLLPEVHQRPPRLGKNFDSQMSDKINSETNIKNLKRVETTVKPSKASEPYVEELPPLNYYLHVFYYSWYGNPQFDGKYIHWNHSVLKHWDPRINKNNPQGKHNPPDDIGSSFYPELGTYSSRDPAVIETHMKQIYSASIGNYFILCVCLGELCACKIYNFNVHIINYKCKHKLQIKLYICS